MTKGVPSNPRTCLRCGLPYQPSSGPQMYCINCRPAIRNEYSKRWRNEHPERRRLIDQKVIAKRPEYYRAMRKYSYHLWREGLRNQVFAHYSNRAFKCACCGEAELDFLTIDHINGGGNAHRRAVFGSSHGGGKAIYRWLVKTGFPEGFQLLCYNCNASKGKHGVCAHRKRPEAPIKPNRFGSADCA